MKALELFSGAGGLALGVKNGGFECEGLLERDKNACGTLRANFSSRVFEVDIAEFDYAALQGQVDIIAGGPPCQPFSIGGKARGQADARDMFPEAVRAIRALRPRAFIFENVKGLMRPSFASYFEYITLCLTYPSLPKKAGEAWADHLIRLERVKSAGRPVDLEYSVLFQCLNAADYGVPQKRERVFFVGFRKGLNVEWAFPKQTHSRKSLDYAKFVTGAYWDETGATPSPQEQEVIADGTCRRRLTNDFGMLPPDEHPWKTIRQALKGLPEPWADGDADISGHQLRQGARPYPGHTGSPLDEPGKALKAGDHGVPGGENMIRFHDGRVRYLTIREAARVQTFPDGFEFAGVWTEAMRQLGNAVPVRLAEAVARSAGEALVRTA
ncbi:MAG: DNA cytosine methyltransferase [Gammaproteobacteria bacterium AqS3]|nr:DNA cytosine methyltransferase [Gammaproteobacteria bacterium AqS3]